MANMDYERMMDILYEEYGIATRCALMAHITMEETINPLKRIKLLRDYKMFMNHSVAVKIAIEKIEKENEEMEP